MSHLCLDDMPLSLSDSSEDGIYEIIASNGSCDINKRKRSRGECGGSSPHSLKSDNFIGFTEESSIFSFSSTSSDELSPVSFDTKNDFSFPSEHCSPLFNDVDDCMTKNQCLSVVDAINPSKEDASVYTQTMPSCDIRLILHNHWKHVHENRASFYSGSLNASDVKKRTLAQSLINLSHWHDGVTHPNQCLLPESLIPIRSSTEGETSSNENLSINSPSTLFSQSKYHQLKRLKPHQLDGIRFMWEHVMEGPVAQVPVVGCILAHTMGLGKTSQIIVLVHLWVNWLHKTSPKTIVRIVVVAPKSVVPVWDSEFSTWSEHWPPHERLSVYVMHPQQSADERFQMIQCWKKQGGALLINYEGLTNQRVSRLSFVVDELTGREILSSGDLDFSDLLVCDEAHRIRSAELQCVKALKRLGLKRCLLLTGTPLQNHLLEYWSMIDLCLPGYFNRHIFKEYFVDPIEKSMSPYATTSDIALGKKKTFTLIQELQDISHRVSSEPLRQSLPPLHQYVVVVPLSPLQKRLYDLFVKLIQPSPHSRTSCCSFLQAVACANKICSHPTLLQKSKDTCESFDTIKHKDFSIGQKSSPRHFFDDQLFLEHPLLNDLNKLLRKERGNHHAPELNDSTKWLVALKIILHSIQLGEKCLVFSTSTKALDLFEFFLTQTAEEGSVSLGCGTDHKSISSSSRILFVRLDGSYSNAKRQTALQCFSQPINSGGAHVLLLSVKAGGVGLTIVSATRLIILDSGFNPTDDQQAISRAFRYGQVKPVFVYHLVCENTLEHRIFTNKFSKEWLFKTIVDNKILKRGILKRKKGLRFLNLFSDSRSIEENSETKLKKQERLKSTSSLDIVLMNIHPYTSDIFEQNTFLENADDYYGEEEDTYYQEYRENQFLFNNPGDFSGNYDCSKLKKIMDDSQPGTKNENTILIEHSSRLSKMIEDILEQRVQENPHFEELFKSLYLAPALSEKPSDLFELPPAAVSQVEKHSQLVDKEPVGMNLVVQSSLSNQMIIVSSDSDDSVEELL